MAVDVVIGTGFGRSTQLAEIDISIDSQGQPVRSFQLNLAFDGTALPNVVGSAGAVALPPEWLLTFNLAGLGDFRVLAIDFSGEGAELLGNILHLSFSVAPSGSATFPITASLAEFTHKDGSRFTVNVVDGRIIIMATYEELFQLGTDTALRNKVVVAVTIKAHAISVLPTPTQLEINWARNAFSSPIPTAEMIYHAILAANSSATVSQIVGASDAAIQTNVDAIVDAIFSKFTPIVTVP